jgi:ferredoxin
MERKKPEDFPIWVQTLGHMVAYDAQVRVHCDTCRQWCPVDLLELLRKVQRPEYSLIDRRCRCRLTAGCSGWNRFSYCLGVYRPLWTNAAAERWMIDNDKRKLEAAGNSAV